MATLDALVALLERATGGLDEVIETHAAVIGLAGDYAYKLKKPVSFSFLDFSTRDARRAALEHELALNQRTAPAIYLDVLPIGEDGRFNGDGETVEWALRMARFDNRQRLDRLLDRGLIDPVHIDELARAIARFQRDLPPFPESGGAAAIGEVINGNAIDLQRSVPTIFSAESARELNEATRSAFERLAPTLDLRRDTGWVRHCHGDLHSENVVVIDSLPVLFDCIEFNDEFAKIDLLYDIAFIVMDLDERGHREHAWRLLQTYLDWLPQDAGLGLLPLFLALRATIRAKLTAFVGESERANAYLTFASKSLEPTTPQLIAIGGLSGSGKTTSARAIAPSIGAAPGAFHLQSDVQRKALFGVEPNQKLGDEAYTGEVSARVFDHLCERASYLLKVGRSVIVDRVFDKPEQRCRIEHTAREAGVPFSGLWLETDVGRRVERVAQRRGDASDATEAVATTQENYDLGSVTWHRLDASRGIDETSTEIRSYLKAWP